MTLKEIKDWLKTQVDSPNWYIGKIDGNKEQCIGFYNVKGPLQNIALGGIENTTYTTKAISILVHWSKDPNAAEIKAKEVYDKFFSKTAVINNHQVTHFDIKASEPISVGTDDNGIYEYVIPMTIFYER